MAAVVGRTTQSDRGRREGRLMYGALWRLLPGPIWLKIVLLIILVAVVLYCLVTWVFPWVDSLLQSNEEGTVGV